MTVQTLKTEIEKINQQLDEFENPKMTDYNKEYYEKKFGKDAEKEFLKVVKKHPVESYAKYNELQSKKQGLIQGAKMMIEDEIKILESLGLVRIKESEDLDFNTVYQNDTYDIVHKKLTELKQLNNWLDLEVEEKMAYYCNLCGCYHYPGSKYYYVHRIYASQIYKPKKVVKRKPTKRWRW